MESEKKVYLFDGENFNNWSFRMEILLEELDLLECIREEEEEDLQVQPSDSAEVKREKEARLIERKRRNVTCKSVLVRNIADSQLEHIKGKQTPREIWVTLENTFARKGISGQFYLLKKLSAMKFVESCSLQAHLLQFERMVRDLEGAGIKLQESLVVFYLLQTMPNSYGQLVTVLETLSPEQCTLDFVKSRLLSESLKREHSDVAGGSSDSTAFATKSAKQRIKCFECKKFGHKRSECPQLRGSDQAKPKKKEFKFAKKEKAHVSESEITFVCSSVNKNDKKFDHGDFKWILDSGSSDHMICSREFLRDVKKLTNPVPIRIASGEVLNCHHIGKVDMIARVGDRRVKCVVDNVLFVPGLNYNLFSIRRVGQYGMEVVFSKNSAVIKRDGKVVCTGSRSGRLYELNVDVKKPVNSEVLVSQKAVDNAELWHRRFGHIGKSGLVKMISEDLVRGLSLKKEAVINVGGVGGGSVCGPCMEGKQTRSPFVDQELPRSSRPLELVHSDVCGKMNPTSWNGKRYFVTFSDDFTHFCAAYIISTKDEVLECFKTYTAMAEAHFDSSISRLRCDNGGEYVGRAFADFCRGKGIQLEFTVPYSPQQNGVSERFNRTILDKARAMIADCGLNRNMWNEAVLAAVYLVNRSPTAAVKSNKTPYELWYGHKPDVSRLRIFGSKAFCHIPKEKRSKLEPRSKTSYFVGYGGGGYRMWDGKRIYIARDVVVEELALNQQRTEYESIAIDDPDPGSNHGQLVGPISPRSAPEPEPSNEVNSVKNEQMSEDEEFDEAEDRSFEEDSVADQDERSDVNEPGPRRSERLRKPPAKLADYTCIAYALNAESYVENVPDSIEELKKLQDWPEWKLAINEELKSLAENNTWELVDLPAGRKPIDCKWVFRLKFGPDGTVLKRKARLVAKGCTQRFGFDFSETYAPVVKMSTVRSMLALANQFDLVVHQMDVTSAFLNGALNEDIYMRQPKGFEEGGRMCRLNKSIYGLKQASKAWNDRFNEFISSCGFRRCQEDSCMYVRVGKFGQVYLLLYVDDVLIIAKNLDEVKTVKRMLRKEFKMQDLGEAQMFLGLRIERDRSKGVMKLSQSKYVDAVLKRFGMESCKPSPTPMEPSLQLKKPEAEQNLCKPYRELIGCLTYLMVTSRPDISSAVSYFSQFQCNPGEEHWKHAKRILRYLRGTSEHGLVYTKKDPACRQIVGYADANWATDINDRHSVSGYLIQIYGSTTAWSTRKQRTVALSSTEAECYALADCICEILWICKLFEELDVREGLPADIFEDNQSTIAIAESDGSSKKLKHTEVKLYFIKQCVQEGKVNLRYISTTDQPADILTKGLPVTPFAKHRAVMGVEP